MSISLRMRLSLYWRMAGALVITGLTALVVSVLAVFMAGVIPGLILNAMVGFGLVWMVAISGIVLSPFLYVLPAIGALSTAREELHEGGEPAAETNPELVEMARQLAQQADIPEPEVRIVPTEHPESYALGSKSDGEIFLTSGLLSELSDEQIEAVIAHEISHLANGDSLIMELSLLPMFVAGKLVWHPGDTARPQIKMAALLTYVTVKILHAFCKLGVALLSRGRELAADDGAAMLTGSPSALASALQELDDVRERPDEDKRSWGESVASLDILPEDGTNANDRLWRTHPSTERRIGRLEAMIAEMEASRP